MELTFAFVEFFVDQAKNFLLVLAQRKAKAHVFKTRILLNRPCLIALAGSRTALRDGSVLRQWRAVSKFKIEQSKRLSRRARDSYENTPKTA